VHVTVRQVASQDGFVEHEKTAEVRFRKLSDVHRVADNTVVLAKQDSPYQSEEIDERRIDCSPGSRVCQVRALPMVEVGGNMMPFGHYCRAFLGAALLSGAPLLSYAQEQPAVDPEALQLLKAMSDYLVPLKQFTVRGEAAREDVLGSGQKLLFHNQFRLALQRPNKLHLARQHADKDLELFYDGEQITLFGKLRKVYATTSAPPTIDETLDFVAEALGISTSARDLFYEDVYDELVSDVVSGSYLGEVEIDGVLCEHLAFRSEDADWQIWIEQGERPLPRKYVITARWLVAAPTYAVRLREWDLSPNLTDKEFLFKAPEDASRIRFLYELSRSGTKAK